MFIDRTKITVTSGRGGDGCVSFRREKYVSAGGPDGGDGGDGGDIVFEVDPRTSTLMDFRFRHKFTAQNGSKGAGYKKTGKSGDDLVIGVPRGTLIYDDASGRLLADLKDEDSRIVLLKGGKGGQGNQHFATATRQVPNFARAGEEGRTLELRLELKMIADVGIVGFPSVGKSTLLSVTTAAKPEIAEYHFTTIVPNLGVVYCGEDGSGFVLADIPGLIEGAAEGAGLGHEFLRHVERTRLLLHVIDVSGSEGRDPFEDFLAINKELYNFDQALAKRPQIIVLNKVDMDSDGSKTEAFMKKFDEWLEKNDEEIRENREKGAYKVFTVMAAIAEGTDKLMKYTGSILHNFEPEEFVVEGLPEESTENDDAYEIHIDTDGAYSVTGRRIRNLALSINMTDQESFGYFQMQLRKKGVFDKLREMGIKDGDTVRIYECEFDFMD
ncbi:MAG: GTPase ObgE [Clostridia bacterium]|nr:GTPase ObgE [Clostridia bacterium]